MFFSGNIKLLRKRKGLTQQEIAESLKMKRSTLSGYENKIAQPNNEALLEFSEYFNISIDTLIKVDLSKLSEFYLSELEKGSDSHETGSNIRVLATTVDEKSEYYVELVSEKDKEKYKTEFTDPEFIKTLHTFHLPYLSKEKKYRAFQISDETMLPITKGSWVVCEYVQNWKQLCDNYAYIIFTLNDGIRFKIVENKKKENGFLRLHSLNPLYEPYDVAVKEIKEIWMFVKYISSELPEPSTNHNNLVKKIDAIRSDVEQIKKHIGISGKLYE